MNSVYFVFVLFLAAPAYASMECELGNAARFRFTHSESGFEVSYQERNSKKGLLTPFVEDESDRIYRFELKAEKPPKGAIAGSIPECLFDAKHAAVAQCRAYEASNTASIFDDQNTGTRMELRYFSFSTDLTQETRLIGPESSETTETISLTLVITIQRPGAGSNYTFSRMVFEIPAKQCTLLP
jgi:hypothetical protein